MFSKVFPGLKRVGFKIGYIFAIYLGTNAHKVFEKTYNPLNSFNAHAPRKYLNEALERKEVFFFLKHFTS